MLKIKEIFYSIQGEGRHAGRAAIFIRFSGCNLECDFCDTIHEEGSEMSTEELITVVKHLHKGSIVRPMIVLTGGEPFIQNTSSLKTLVNELLKHKYYIAIETNGTQNIEVDVLKTLDWITVSPKEICKYHTSLSPQFINEIKLVVTKDVTKEVIDAMHLKFCDKVSYFYLQPESNKEESINKCITFIKEDPRWQMSVQLQKVLSIQ